MTSPAVLFSRRARSLAACRTSSAISRVVLMHQMLLHQTSDVKDTGDPAQECRRAPGLPCLEVKKSWPWTLGVVAVTAVGVFLWVRQGPLAVSIASATRGPAVDAIYATGTVEPTVMLPIA